MTLADINETYLELKALGYPLDDDTQVITDIGKKEMVGFAFEDHGFRITVKKEIIHENDNKG